MKVIDLLNKIANGDIPKRIEYGKGQFHWNEKIRNYEDDNFKYAYINWDIVATSKLNDEVKVIKDKKIEHYYFSVFQDERLGGRQVVESLESKINEIIDYINGGTNGE